MTSNEDNKAFGKEFLEKLVDWISGRFAPEEVFHDVDLQDWAAHHGYWHEDYLEDWAEENGYVKGE